MITATILGEERKFEDGTTFLQAAKMYQDRFEDDILLACADGNLRELWKEIPDVSAVSFRTGADDSGRRTYQRSAIFLMLKAFHDVIGTRKIEKITIEFSIGNGLYGEAKGDFVLDDGLISRVKTRMKELAAANVGKLGTIARQGRALGISLIVATQRPDANILPGQIKNNIDYRICGKADDVLSQMILGNTDAADQIPKDSQGLFLSHGGTIFRGFWLDTSHLERSGRP